MQLTLNDSAISWGADKLPCTNGITTAEVARIYPLYLIQAQTGLFPIVVASASSLDGYAVNVCVYDLIHVDLLKCENVVVSFDVDNVMSLFSLKIDRT